MSGPPTFTDADVFGGRAAAPRTFSDDEVFSGRARAIPPQIDTRTGAPAGVRAMVGSFTKPEDRLAALRRVFPDAQHYGDGNFVYTDPRTGRPTLYNEENPRIFGMLPVPTVGDIASLAPEIAETAGGTMGAVIGAPLGPGGAAVGAGLGAAGAREMQNLLMQGVTGARDTRTLPERASDAALTVTMQTLGQRAGDWIGDAVRGVITTPGAPQRARDLAGAQVRATPGTASGSRAVQTVEHGLINTPGGAVPMANAAAQMVDDIARETRRVSQSYGTARGTTEAGRLVRAGVQAGAQRMDDRIGAAFDAAYDLVGADRAVPMTNTARYAAELVGGVSQAEETLTPAYRQALVQARSILTDARARGGTLPFATAREIRTALGNLLEDRSAQGPSRVVQPALRQLYGALSRDLDAAALAAGPDAARAIRQANALTFGYRQHLAPFVDRILATESDDALWQMVQRWSRDDAAALARLRGTLTRDEWGAVGATLLDRMGLPVASAQGAVEVGGQATQAGFSISTFLTNWAKIADNPRATRLLFGSPEHANLVPALNRLVRVIGYAKEGERLANVSGTARSVLTASSGPIAAGGALLGGNLPLAAQILLGGTVAPWAGAKLITSPRFVNWLASASRTDNPNALRYVVGRLGAVAGNDPDLRRAVNDYRAALDTLIAPLLPEAPRTGLPAAQPPSPTTP